MSNKDNLIKKYVRTGDQCIVPAAKNPAYASGFDSVHLQSEPDFGDLGVVIDWQYITSEAVVVPLQKAECEHYITVIGGDFQNQLELTGEIEFTIGLSPDELHSVKFNAAATMHVQKGVYYSVRLVKLRNADFPPIFNDCAFVKYGGSAVDPQKFEWLKSFAYGDAVWNRYHPHPEVVLNSTSTLSRSFEDAAPIRRCWMPISEPFSMEIKSHYHEFDQYLEFHGTDPKNPKSLGGTIEFTIGDTEDTMEKFTVTEATQFLVKRKLYHSPLVFAKVDDPSKPILMSEISFASSYDRSAEIGAEGQLSEYELFAEKMKKAGLR
ncbi:MAG: hypothetical protein LBO63_07225 [Oscillospiraceae bacterium]|jgi:hypothetical protein|nr:hypothetical protein [Oscillospiraceae bacterium]